MTNKNKIIGGFKMNKEKLTLIFTSGFSTLLVVAFENMNENDDLIANLETVYYEIIKPNKYYGLVVHEDDMESYGIEKDEDGDYMDMIYIDEGYYISCETLHCKMMSEEELEEYKNESINIFHIAE